MTEMKKHYRVLDHGYVKCVENGHMGDDLTPLQSARMSTDKATGVDPDADHRLRERLWSDQHTSVFESNVLAVEVQLPLFTLQQFDRHRTVDIANGIVFEDYDSFRKFHSENEFSGRYSQMPDLHYRPLLKRYGGKNGMNKQGTGEALPDWSQAEGHKQLITATLGARGAYDEMTRIGISSEVSRFALTYTQYTKVRLQANLLNWFKFLDLRLREDVQLETRIYARCIARIVRDLWPKCWDVFSEHTLYGVRFGAHEIALMRSMFGTDMLGRDRHETCKRAAIASGFTPSAAQRFADKLCPTGVNPYDFVDGPLPIDEFWDLKEEA